MNQRNLEQFAVLAQLQRVICPQKGRDNGFSVFNTPANLRLHWTSHRPIEIYSFVISFSVSRLSCAFHCELFPDQYVWLVFVMFSKCHIRNKKSCIDPFVCSRCNRVAALQKSKSEFSYEVRVCPRSFYNLLSTHPLQFHKKWGKGERKTSQRGSVPLTERSFDYISSVTSESLGSVNFIMSRLLSEQHSAAEST